MLWLCCRKTPKMMWLRKLRYRFLKTHTSIFTKIHKPLNIGHTLSQTVIQPVLWYWPRINSMKKSGKPPNKNIIVYGTRKAPPPFLEKQIKHNWKFLNFWANLPQINGNLHTFPRSTAKPMTARRNSVLLSHFSRFFSPRLFSDIFDVDLTIVRREFSPSPFTENISQRSGVIL